MLKAILILDKMPENCMECELRFKDGDKDDWFRFRCHMSTDQIPKQGRLCNCPLKPIPKSINEEKALDITKVKDHTYLNGVVDGFSICLDEILGGNKNA